MTNALTDSDPQIQRLARSAIEQTRVSPSLGVDGSSSLRPNIERKTIAEDRIKNAIEPFREYDGKVFSVAQYVYAREGITPPLPRSANGVSITLWYGFRVLDVTTNGCRIKPVGNEWIPSEKEYFVEGLTGLSSGKEYRNTLMFFKTDSVFDFSGLPHDNPIICDFGKPITAEQYVQRVKITPVSGEQSELRH
jgi:hypothetical protein